MNQNSDVKNMLKETAILTVITLMAGLLLGFVYELTKEPIRIQREKAVQEACMAVFSGVEGLAFEEVAYAPTDERMAEFTEKSVNIGTVYEAKKADGSFYGYVVQSTSTAGYNGDIVLYVGIDGEGVLNDVSILEISETPGLGLSADKVLVPQFHDKKVESFAYTKTGSTADNEIDAISGATITTKAVTNAVNSALLVAQDMRGGL